MAADSRRENILRALRFERPEYIPMVFHINESCWSHYPKDALEELIGEHPFLFPDDEGGPGRAELDYVVPERVGRPFTDGWGCLWETALDGIVGTVTKHPLANWSDFNGYLPPDPNVDSGKGPAHWPRIRRNIEHARVRGEFTLGGLRHGHTFQQLIDLRGYENLLFDMADGDARLLRLIEMVETFNLAIVRHYLDIGVDMMTYAEDLGMQCGPMLSPAMFRNYIKPVYTRLMAPAKDAGCIIHMHSDGQLHQLLDDLLDSGVAALNLQDLVNGIDWIKQNLKGKICIDLDIDRQTITPKASPADVDNLIRHEVQSLGAKEGGLMMIYGLYPGVPLPNVKALMDVMEKYAFFYS